MSADGTGARSETDGITPEKSYVLHPVKMQVDLLPDSESYEPVVFYEKDTGKRHVLLIESVELFDPYREIQEYLNTPGLDRDAQADIAMIMTDHMIRHANDAPRYEIRYLCADAQVVFKERNDEINTDSIVSNPAFSNALAFLGASIYQPDNSGETVYKPNGPVGGSQEYILQYKKTSTSPLELYIDSCFS